VATVAKVPVDVASVHHRQQNPLRRRATEHPDGALFQGEFANTNLTSNVADLVAAADMLRDGDQAPALLVGPAPR